MAEQAMFQEEDDEACGTGQRGSEQRLLPPQRVLGGLRVRPVDPQSILQFNGEQHMEEGRYHERNEELLVQGCKE